MKHRFLLDENIFIFAVTGKEPRGADDPTSGDLVRSIAGNCHQIILNLALCKRYWPKIKALERSGLASQEMVSLVAQLLSKPEKTYWEHGDPPELPAGVRIPEKDKLIVRSALGSEIPIVTTDEPLWQAINSQRVLGLRALTPAEALVLARET